MTFVRDGSTFVKCALLDGCELYRQEMIEAHEVGRYHDGQRPPLGVGKSSANKLPNHFV